MRRSVVRGALFAVSVAAFWIPGERSAHAFDTFWHSAATGAMGREYGFTQDALNVTQFGNFAGPDFFGPLYDTVEPMLFGKLGHRPEDFETWSRRARKMAIFMHFDNLNGKLRTNAQFDYLFVRLLWNTHMQLLRLYGDPNLVEGKKKIAILETLGMSLHMVQDFYSHSDWTHNTFATWGVPLVHTSWGEDRAPTWFEVRAQLGDPACWPFEVHSGIYPPTPGSPNTHSHMNHDNSQLVYEEHENPGSPTLPQAQYHSVGPRAASVFGARLHQLFAINTAAGASIEWVTILEQRFPSAKAAIDYVKGWDIRSYNPAMLSDLTNGLEASLVLSCGAKKWDGNNPPPARQAPCKVGNWPILLGSGLAGFLNEFWGNIVGLDLVEHLTEGFGSQAGDYVFDDNYARNHLGSNACPTPHGPPLPPPQPPPSSDPQPQPGPQPHPPPAPTSTSSPPPPQPAPPPPGPPPGPPGPPAPPAPGEGCIPDGSLCDQTGDCCGAASGVTCTNRVCARR